MHVIAELEQRLRDSRRLMALEEEHLRRVRDAGLDSTDAEWLLELRRRYIERLESRHDHIVARRMTAHANANVPLSTVSNEEVPQPQGISSHTV
ncbi:hypothetical protein [Dyella jiangningensis]|uniref:Uncharacterized protein n=1 Tax=Dyella jiangningensis TaxID=1379159 RepID=A0A328P8E4_9GAMM|nr:hypothetical protein [Dyella jiangningensis]RAO76806.1 hypothetical protein CA260_02500 [Dyella jiangningensis]